MKKRSILPFVTKPGRYLGQEFNIITKAWDDVALHCVLVFPDLYEIGMSHQGLQILYHILNARQDILAERSYCPDIDVERLLKEKDSRLTSLESDRHLADFDIIGITLPYELCYTNILTVLDLAAIPFYARERDDTFPLVLGGGSCSMNPEPVADFFDAILLGDGEEAIEEIADIVRKAKEQNCDKNTLLEQLSRVDGLYVPSFFKPEYDEAGRIVAIQSLQHTATQVQRRILPDLDKIDHLQHPLVPNARIVHDRLGVEVARGCTRGCRFCQAGIIYRPVRERTTDQVMQLAKCGIDDSGFDELALLSLSTGDYSCLEELLPQLMNSCAPDYVSVAMPSMRVGTLSPKVMEQIKRVRKTGFTLAPEAGSERLRRVINKGITEEDLLTTCSDAFSLGWTLIKLYFMIGLPTETWEDIDAIAELAKKAKKVGDKSGQKRRQINVSIGTFVPKPHTPFQWERQLTLEESRERIDLLKKIMPRKGCKLKWHDPKQSFLEGVFSRGDRRLAELILTAWKNGARLDAWSDYFDLSRWQVSAEQCKITLDDFLRQRDTSEILPWQHLHTGVTSTFFQEELEKAHAQAYTADCRYFSCHKCGICDFKTIKPIVHGKRERVEENQAGSSAPQHIASNEKRPVEDSHYKYMVTYSRTGKICYLGHLEILQLIFRTLRRAKITTNFSQGFNPSPKISFGPAMSVGTESLAEYFIMDLPHPLRDNNTTRLLNSNLPPGLEIQSITLHSGKIPQNTMSAYEVTLPRDLLPLEKERLLHFQKSSSFIIERLRKGKRKELNIRPLIKEIILSEESILHLQTISRSGSPGVKVQEALMHVLDLDEETHLLMKVKKTGWIPLQQD